MSGFGAKQSAIKESKAPFTNSSHTESGMVPEICDSWSVKARKFVKVPIASGTIPVKKLSCNCKNSIFGNTPIPLILPVIILSFKSSCSRRERDKSSVERLPVNELKSKSKKNRLRSKPISVGIVPDNPPRSMPKSSKSVSRPISVGIKPTKLFNSVPRKQIMVS